MSLTKLSGLLGLLAILQSYSADAAVVAYPKKGQSENQQTKDKSSCAQWATKQTGVDPLALATEAQESIPQGTTSGHAVRGAGRGAAVGAIGGAIAGNPGKGAAIGAGVGGAGGLARRGQQERANEQANAESKAGVQKKLHKYEQAQKTCLEGKGYSVSSSS